MQLVYGTHKGDKNTDPMVFQVDKYDRTIVASAYIYPNGNISEYYNENDFQVFYGNLYATEDAALVASGYTTIERVTGEMKRFRKGVNDYLITLGVEPLKRMPSLSKAIYIDLPISLTQFQNWDVIRISKTLEGTKSSVLYKIQTIKLENRIG